ncbi:hypothetical protein [Neptunomonas concharum]|uniref:Uncharacterized protein n=1 Tax=Neptunomonas concharum TaxID=1031538 RepID=A0A5P1RC15_9GAMM|nr:hypothetical protein [Neptunomonas concharum]QEQ97204.1 hypothetical protein F0U83_11035 [Neptunomonas concharum]
MIGKIVLGAVLPLSLTSFLASASTPLGFAPWISSNCYSESWEGEVRHGQCQINYNTGGYPRWSIGGTHEYADFSGGTNTDIRLLDPVMDVSFIPRTDFSGVYEARLVLDKISYPHYRDNQGRDIRTGYSGIFLGETAYARNLAQKPVFTLAEDVNVYLEVDLESVQRTVLPSPAWVGNAEVRVILGAVAQWGGKSHFVEFNLMRTPGFDRCHNVNINNNPSHPYAWRPLLNTIPAYGISSAYPAGLGLGSVCDTQNRYDHRFVGLDGTGHFNKDHATSELVYYNVANLPIYPQPSLVAGAGYQSFNIPVSRIFRDYNWAHKPINQYGNVDWSSVKSFDSNDLANGEVSFYFGIEIYGAGKSTVKMKTFNIYKN